MDLTDVVRRRHMVREFTDKPVAPETLDRILANAVRGPSAGFSQGMAALLILLTVVDEGLGALHFAAVPPRTSCTSAAGDRARQ